MWVVIEIIRDNEGNPGVWAFANEQAADDHLDRLKLENEWHANEDVLYVKRLVAVVED